MTAVTKTLGTTLLALSFASASQAGPPRRCVDESEKLVGQRAVLADDPAKLPRKIRAGAFDYPTRAEPGMRSNIWLGEVLVDREGKVREVWTIRPLRFEPAWPEFEAALVAGLRTSVYEPVIADGQAVPVCLTVAMNFNR